MGLTRSDVASVLEAEKQVMAGIIAGEDVLTGLYFVPQSGGAASSEPVKVDPFNTNKITLWGADPTWILP